MARKKKAAKKAKAKKVCRKVPAGYRLKLVKNKRRKSAAKKKSAKRKSKR